MKPIISIILLLVCLTLSAAGHNEFGFMQEQVSSIGNAMGRGYIGVADVWHHNPLLAYDNPAMPAMHDGLAFGITQDPLWDNHGFYELERDAGMMTFGYKGLGIMLPLLNPDGKFGNELHYGDIPVTFLDDFGSTRNYHIYEIARSYGISFNPLKYMRENTKNYADDYPWLNLSVGIAYNRLYSNIIVWEDTHKQDSFTANVLDLGMVALATQKLGDNLVLEGSLGYKKYNVTNDYVKYPETGHTYPVGQNDVMGLGLACSIPTSALDNELIQSLTENIFTVRGLGDQNSSKFIDNTYSVGLEGGIFDTVFLRYGHYYNWSSQTSGETRGIGINLHYQNLVALEYNYAEYPGGQLMNTQHCWDAMLMVDGIALMQKFQSQ